MVAFRALVCFALLAVAAAASVVKQCPGKSIANLEDNVHLSCKKSPCKLKRGTTQNVTVTFTPEVEMEDVTNGVTAKVLGVDVPFVGVDGNSICDKIFFENGDKASCPLKAGTTIVYRDSFPVLDFYPTISVPVHWGLKHHKEEFMCFEVPARIV